MGFIGYLITCLIVLVIKTKKIEPHFHYEKVLIVLYSITWPIALLGWSITGISILIVDEIQRRMNNERL